MKDPENKKYIKLGITGVAIVVIGLLCFFLLFRFESLSAGLHMVLGILTPFVYGAVIAYILTPVCNKIERLLGKLLGKNGFVPTLSIVLSLVSGLCPGLGLGVSHAGTPPGVGQCCQHRQCNSRAIGGSQYLAA